MKIDYTSYKDVDLVGKKILMRVDINSNIDLEKMEIRDSPRIRALVLALNEHFKNSAVIILAHQSRPGKDDFTDLDIHAKEIEKYLKRPVKFVKDIYGEQAVQAIKDLKVGETLVLNNVRKFEGEMKGYKDFTEAENTDMVKTLFPLVDYVIVDAFGAAHRAHASIVGWPKMMVGPITDNELNALKKIMENPERPMAMLIGGAKAIDKFKAMKYNFDNEKLDYALCSGLTAILVFEALGKNMGEQNHKIIAEDLEEHKDMILETYENYKDKIILPEDLIIDDNGNRKTIGIDEAGTYNTTTGDIGLKTVEKFSEIIMKCKTIIANGPPGIFEMEVFREATNKLVETMVQATKKNNALTIIGGGEMGAAAAMSGKADGISFISTAGGAMLEILSGKDLPMIRALREKKA
ncbi:MAG: Phosphoglycerate kinase [Candidatus Lokiarchaeum sp. GC14_75]|nr:MAG: Phosphoglycerate kinase [Candidatus Lokiarchaeum sp. GC14_75]